MDALTIHCLAAQQPTFGLVFAREREHGIERGNTWCARCIVENGRCESVLGWSWRALPWGDEAVCYYCDCVLKNLKETP